MITFDESQLRVLGLDPSRHARVIGAPGTGKTTLLVELCARQTEVEGYIDGDVLVLATSRLVAARVRAQVEKRLSKAIGGNPVRTAASFAFSVLQRRAALVGEVAPRLLTGTALDEAAANVIELMLEGQLHIEQRLPYVPEVLRSEALRSELREMQRVLDDFDLEPSQLLASLGIGQNGNQYSLPEELALKWRSALSLLEAVQQRLVNDRPGEMSSSAMMRAARAALREENTLRLPRLVLVDDAAEVGEGALALLAALAERGATIWAFGDPDIATGAYQGERARLLAGVSIELARRSGAAAVRRGDEQVEVLRTVYRHTNEIRAFVRQLTERIGAAGVGQQRVASAVEGASASQDAKECAADVQFATAVTTAEQVGMIAHRLRSRHLAVTGGLPLPWSQMAVICRTRSEVKHLARLLAANQVPTDVAAGGIVLRESQLVRELLRLLQHCLDIAPLTPQEVVGLLGGTIGGVDPIALRRLRTALRIGELRAAAAEGRAAVNVDELIFEGFKFAGGHPVIDMAAARSLRNLGRLAAAGRSTFAAGGTPREVLWQLWQGSKLPDLLQAQALEAKGVRADEAHRTLDAVLGLFFSLQRHEEQDSDRPIAVVIEELLRNALPEDSLAAKSERDVVTVGTAQSMVGREFELVAIVGLQDGTWPNLRARGSLFGAAALERWLRNESAETPSRRDTLHDELRLFAQAASRARSELLVVALANEEMQPSAFFSFGKTHNVDRDLPSSRLTLRGVVAEMRRRVVNDASDSEAVHSLIALAQAGVPGAHPDEWYGVLPPSTSAPLSDIDNDPSATVSVSPSQLERAEECPLNWITSRLAGQSADYRADLGTLLHYALESADHALTLDHVLEVLEGHWSSLKFEADWQEHLVRRQAEAMGRGLVDYVRDFERASGQLVATEAAFEVPLQFARLKGYADRLEATVLADGSLQITVVDLKTGRRRPTAQELEQHAQLQAYQLGVIKQAFSDAQGNQIGADSTQAKLVYIHPGALTKTQEKNGETYVEVSQQGLTREMQESFEERVIHIARTMAAGEFTAHVEHHCENPNTPGKTCALHVIASVSHA